MRRALARYPEIQWLLSMTDYSKWELFKDEDGYNAKSPKQKRAIYKDRKKEIEAFAKKLDQEGTEIVYLLGLGLGYHALYLLDWLEKYPRKAVVVYEEDLGIIEAFLQVPWAEKLLSHPRVHLRVAHFFPKVQKICEDFPADKIQVFPLKGKQGALELSLKRETACQHAFFIEDLYPQKLFENLLRNFYRTSQSFLIDRWKGKFQGMPAIICGAGPSLSASIPLLKELQNRALLLAGGSTIAALSNQGVLPHLGMAIDPNQEEQSRISNSVAFETPLLYGNRLLPSVFETTNSPPGYMSTQTGGALEIWFEKALGINGETIGKELSREAFSITTLATSLAKFLGCSPIIFCGVDLAYTGNKIYAEGVLPENKRKENPHEEILLRKDRNGKTIHTLLKWVMEADALGSFAKNSQEILFYNCTEGGLPIPGIPYRALRELVDTHLQKDFDFSGHIHALKENSLAGFSGKEISKPIEGFVQSLRRVLELCNKILELLAKDKENNSSSDNPLIFLYEEDMKQEEAYRSYLFTIPPSVERWLKRVYLDPESENYRFDFLERKITMWNVCRAAAEQTLELAGNVIFFELVAQGTQADS